jgi:hypothetical protein
MPHVLDGARERLDRAHQNIQNLNTELTLFLAPVPAVELAVDMEKGEAIITDEDRKGFQKINQFVADNIIPPRFRVLAGEVIHHFRSAFDHVAWQLSSDEFQAKHFTRIEFPVFKEVELCGIKKKNICRYCRKIEGIASPTALTRIHFLQPHLRPDPLRDPLWLIHDMDIIDKHRELVLAAFIMNVNFAATADIPGIGIQMPWEITPRLIRYTGPPTNMQMKVKMSAQITLGELRERDDQPIIPTLQNLLRFTSDAVESFAKEFA